MKLLRSTVCLALALAAPVASASVFQDFVESVGSLMPSSGERVSYSALDGAYVGAQFGISNLRSNFDATFASATTRFTLKTTEPTKSVYVGWAGHSGAFFFAAELQQHSDHELSESDTNDVGGGDPTSILHEVVVDTTVSADMFPGYFVANNLVAFLQFGIGYVTQTAEERRISNVPGFIYKDVKRSGAFHVGLGVIYVLNSNLSMRLGWTHIRLPSHNFTNDGISSPFEGEAYRVKSNIDRFIIALSYRIPIYDHQGNGLPQTAFST